MFSYDPKFQTAPVQQVSTSAAQHMANVNANIEGIRKIGDSMQQQSQFEDAKQFELDKMNESHNLAVKLKGIQSEDSIQQLNAEKNKIIKDNTRILKEAKINAGNKKIKLMLDDKKEDNAQKIRAINATTSKINAETAFANAKTAEKNAVLKSLKTPKKNYTPLQQQIAGEGYEEISKKGLRGTVNDLVLDYLKGDYSMTGLDSKSFDNLVLSIQEDMANDKDPNDFYFRLKTNPKGIIGNYMSKKGKLGEEKINLKSLVPFFGSGKPLFTREWNTSKKK